MKLTDGKLKQLLSENNVVVVQRGAVSIGLSKDCYDDVIHNLGPTAEKNWQIVAVLKDEEARE